MAPEEKLQRRLVRFILLAPVVIVVAMTLYSELAWKGYWWFAPAAQPIDFPHSLHAGERGIDCQYCHQGSSNGYQAGVPSVTDCAQCHQGLTGEGTNGPIMDRPGVQKLMGKTDKEDPSKSIAGYVQNRQDIKWFKYYDMPEHVKFAHKAHINAGFECAECHGDVANMEKIVMKQKPTMGWCVSCHRKNEAPSDCTTCHR